MFLFAKARGQDLTPWCFDPLGCAPLGHINLKWHMSRPDKAVTLKLDPKALGGQALSAPTAQKRLGCSLDWTGRIVMLSIKCVIHCFFNTLYILNTDLSTDFVDKPERFKTSSSLQKDLIFKGLLLIIINNNRIGINPHKKLLTM